MTGLVTALLASAAALVLVGPWRRTGLSGPPSRAPGPPTDLAAVVAGVAARLRAGVRVGDAWSQVLGVPVGDDGPDARQLRTVGERRAQGRRTPAVGHVVRGRGTALPGGRWRRTPSPPGANGRAQAVVCADRVAAELGAPLAPVLDTVARALAADAEAEAELGAALAGPQTSARLVGWLPVFGLALGAAVGADPAAVLTDGGPGTAAGIAGVLLFVAGRVWSRTLVDRARRWHR